MATWPNDLPKPKLDSLQETPPDNAIASKMDKGPEKVRRRTTANVRPISFTLILTPEQLETLDVFYTDETFSGVIEFDYIHPRTQAPVTARFKPGSPPTYNESQGVVYTAQIQLEIMP